jgi:hypothetical protein
VYNLLNFAKNDDNGRQRQRLVNNVMSLASQNYDEIGRYCDWVTENLMTWGGIVIGQQER